jgi:hypothetical protein
MKLINDCITEDDGTTYCGAKISAFVALFSYLGTTIYMVVSDHSTIAVIFPAFGTGLATVLAGCGVLIAGKQLTQKASS